MWAAVGVNPLALMLALTLPSLLIVTVPLPDELPCTGGTSCAPVSFTSMVSASAAADVTAKAAASDQPAIRATLFDLTNAFIVDPSWLDESRSVRRRGYTGDGSGTMGTANPIGTNTRPACPIPVQGRAASVHPAAHVDGYNPRFARVVKQVDTRHLKCLGREAIPVRVRSRAPRSRFRPRASARGSRDDSATDCTCTIIRSATAAAASRRRRQPIGRAC